jgi:hypothetical protein
MARQWAWESTDPLPAGLLMRSAGLDGYNRAITTTGWRRDFHSDRRSGEGQKDVRSATLTVNRHRTFICSAEIEVFGNPWT